MQEMAAHLLPQSFIIKIEKVVGLGKFLADISSCIQ